MYKLFLLLLYKRITYQNEDYIFDNFLQSLIMLQVNLHFTYLSL